MIFDRTTGFFAGCALFAALAAPAIADVKDGVDAWGRGDYKAAIREWRGPAAQGDADAQFNLAQAYKLGRGVERDLAMAEKLYAQAAARGHLNAADNLGLLMFQRGARKQAMPYIVAASGRGDPRAQYVLGLAHFNGDGVAKDWVRAYALVSLAQQAGLPQAAGALQQMDEHISLADRQKSVNLAAQIAGEAQATRARQIAAVDLGVTGPGADDDAPVGGLKPFSDPPPQVAAAGSSSPETAGADYARPPAASPRVPPVSQIMKDARARSAAMPPPAPAPRVAVKPATPVFAPAPRPAAALDSTAGEYRVQLGAFGVPGNADKLWAKIRGRPELAGHGRVDVPAGKVSKLMAGGFGSLDQAQAACNRLKAAGFECIPVRR